MSRASPIARLLRRWHKRLGLLGALFFAWIAVSGLALNHGPELGLDAAEVGIPWLMGWYGLKPAIPDQGYPAGGQFFASQGDVWVLAGRRIKAGHGEPVGAVASGGQLWVATGDGLRLYDPEGRLVDTIERDLLPAAPIRRVGTSGDNLVVSAGSSNYGTVDGISWQPLAGNAVVNWSRSAPLDAGQRAAVAALFAPSLPLQRILADAHSGRLFGQHGPLVTDALAAILVLLAGSGAWMYLGTRGRKGGRGKHPAGPEH